MTLNLFPANKHSPWPPREREAELLADLIRLSRLTLLYGAGGSGKTSLLKSGVMPLLHHKRADDGAAELAIFFDAWDAAPLPALQALIDAAVATLAPVPVPEPGLGVRSLADSIAASQQALGVSFLIVFDRFEEYLGAPLDREGVNEFAAQFVEAVNAPALRANFLLSMRLNAEPLLDRFRGRIPGLRDASLRLLPLSHPIP